MTIPSERTESVLQAAALLNDILCVETVVPDGFKRRAAAILRHFPTRADLQETAGMNAAAGSLWPMLWGDPK